MSGLHGLAKITSELEEPFTAIRAYGALALQQLKSDVADKDDLTGVIEKMVQAVDFAKQLLQHLNADDLSANLTLAPIGLDELIGKPCQLLELSLRHFGIELRLPEMPDCQVNVDEAQIQFALIDLMKNSIESRHTESSTRPHIQLEAFLGEQSVELVVIDNGWGVPKKRQENLFEVFTPLSGIQESSLATCKLIVELNGGKIWHSDNSPTGAKFHLTLPLAT